MSCKLATVARNSGGVGANATKMLRAAEIVWSVRGRRKNGSVVVAVAGEGRQRIRDMRECG